MVTIPWIKQPVTQQHLPAPMRALQVDLLEPSRPLLECAQKNLTAKKLRGVPAGHQAINFYCAGLQEHVFEPGR